MVGDRIREARKAKKMTQEKLAERIGVKRSVISKYENGLIDPTISQIEKIASALGIKWYELLPDDQKGAAIAADVIERAGLTLKDKSGNPLKKLPFDEARKLGIVSLTFNSDKDRIAYFYSLLNTDGKLRASKCFYQYLDLNKISDVAAYVERLSEIPQYQLQPQEGDDNAVNPQEDN